MTREILKGLTTAFIAPFALVGAIVSLAYAGACAGWAMADDFIDFLSD